LTRKHGAYFSSVRLPKLALAMSTSAVSLAIFNHITFLWCLSSITGMMTVIYLHSINAQLRESSRTAGLSEVGIRQPASIRSTFWAQKNAETSVFKVAL